jgi:16S rRNA (guanine1207-N2)-methyltransferase
MSKRALDSLFYILAEHQQMLESAPNILFLRARLHEQLDSFVDKLHCVQSFKPLAAELLEAEFSVSPQIATENTVLSPSSSRASKQQKGKLCLYLPTLQKEENFYNFAQCLQWLEEDGILFCSMENKYGASRFEKELERLTGNIESFSKSKCRIFCTTKRSSTLNQELMKEWLSKGNSQLIEGTSFITRPGIFGWNKIDRGSALLCEQLPNSLPGSGADLGAGFGYLSHSILTRIKDVQKLALYEAEALALDVARLNLEKIQTSVEVSYHWHDVRKGLNIQNMDWIVMNPPYHDGGDSDVDLGKTFISMAASSLRPAGELYFVANVRLPYERVVKDFFSSMTCCVQTDGFKVLKAIK